MDPPPPASAPPPLNLPPSSGSGEGNDEMARTIGSAEPLAGFTTTGGRKGKNRPPRIVDYNSRESLVQAFLSLIRQMQAKLFSKRGGYYPFKSKHVFSALKCVKSVLQEEPPLVEMGVPVVIVGDLHGQYVDLVRIFDIFREGKKPGYLSSRYVFLGDYVDRGRQSLEIIMMLMMLKYIYPKQYVLLRGNHECRAINKAYGFYAEIKERFKDPQTALEIFDMFNEVFGHLPLACIVANKALCMHGGISSKIRSREDILRIPKPLKDVSTNEIATDLLWADPMIGLAGETKNKVRGVSVYFGEQTLDNLLKDLKVDVVIRGHQMMMNGFNFFHDVKLITVFSAAAYYPEKPNRGAVMRLDKDGRMSFETLVVIKQDDEEYGGLTKMFRGDHDLSNDFDTGYIKAAPGLAKKQEESSSGDEAPKRAK